MVSILTTTGFTTTNYELWPQLAQMLLFVVCFIGACAGSTTSGIKVVVCFIGACAGSTTSGIKVVHYVVILKWMYVTIKRIFLQPLSVTTIRLNRKPVDAGIIDLSICYFIVNILMVLGGGGIVCLLEKDISLMGALSSIIATLMNIGPGFNEVGPVENYAAFSATTKWFLSWNMLVGRLEMFSALAIFYPLFWKK